MDRREPAIIDTSTLINFLAVDRVDLLLDHQHYRFIVTEHARAEVTEFYPLQSARLNAAIASGGIEETPVTEIAELELFASLASSGRLGDGECASIAAAQIRGWALAIDDKAAIRQAKGINGAFALINTADVVATAIRDKRMTVDEADALKTSWQNEHRFRLPFKSFADILE